MGHCAVLGESLVTERGVLFGEGCPSSGGEPHYLGDSNTVEEPHSCGGPPLTAGPTPSGASHSAGPCSGGGPIPGGSPALVGEPRAGGRAQLLGGDPTAEKAMISVGAPPWRGVPLLGESLALGVRSSTVEGRATVRGGSTSLWREQDPK